MIPSWLPITLLALGPVGLACLVAAASADEQGSPNRARRGEPPGLTTQTTKPTVAIRAKEMTVPIPSAGDVARVLREVNTDLDEISHDLLTRILTGLRRLDTDTGRHHRDLLHSSPTIRLSTRRYPVTRSAPGRHCTDVRRGR